MHAASADDALAILQRYPLDVSPASVAAIDLIVTLKLGMVDGRSVRRVTAIERILPRNGRPAVQRLAERNPLRAAPQLASGRMVAALSAWGEISEDEAARLLVTQERFLAGCVAREADDAATFRDQIALFRAGA
jgi:hypothetical protein